MLFWQETAEMIVWLMHDADHERKCEPRQRLLVSQDNHEIWLTIATLKNGYLEDLKTGNIYQKKRSGKRSRPVTPHMVMQTYGPWNITNQSNLEDLAKIILALALEVTDDLNN